MEIDFRIDLLVHIVPVDEKANIFQLCMKHHPRRYNEIVIDGKEYLFDKFTNIYIEKEKFYNHITEQMKKGTPINLQEQEIESIDAYIESRLAEIENRLEKDAEEDYTFIDKSEEILSSIKEKTHEFAIMSVDIVGSTELSAKIGDEKYARIISTILHEFSFIIPKFKGIVLKYTGDGLLSYFPSPSFIRMNDLCFDCANCIRQLFYKGINAILEKKILPKLGLRIGIDSGEAQIKEIGSPSSKFHKDIIGFVINRATKIQSIAEPGNIAIGEYAARMLYIMYREILEEMNLDSSWKYKNKNGETYKVYKIKEGSKISYP
jgi:adenylate cyclase